ncbi:MAG: DNA helicase UvrD [Candidatus Kerfeldbacteria bacterium RIFCSPHIGHO2_02_FULL_42_14]|uniref:DNA helicase UvrD n=1 Tax=Candidatus Kerfeldbacteria bacterium RIFCSPHIGHO2_02_FULL_42_14 TaxID=1798540 RepID=A0A1G2APB9_9BACT|nr:MAG: DNA helicase UvrD [Candidatus Kerfeldbacteria bacterium RIFCSPHIGHO2_02_FULL_42_14]OGY80899.1 MAG: DNA helicase UvrD [Candidatus Kerfeldbacteria bacterium RIFCSPHIGHO2_12_FULL_42_13]OGY84132.1 MAG: DNA helicase UvrD [Candidatus Kerfeldbacteria bacterium RIFCSPLOWO2_02_FULL_42_19]OGY87262.1 MAG: DNA helicase UvrD [Candidatus Kerfeldbacteria bacterium RIFCSPLOWO2_12_FULL_43_9]
MKPYILDLHIHSRFSRGCSKYLTLDSVAAWCEKKGIDIVATGDFTHPGWFTELKQQLVETEPGLYSLTNKTSKTRFICSTEISCIYKKNDATRRIHVLIVAPNLIIVEKINTKLNEIGNIKSDGRPILGLDVKELLKICLEIDERCLMIPAHIWTPWFSLFGSKSGFDHLEDCFEEMTPYIYAIETGLSSDPKMNWGLKQLNNLAILSHSDAHSVENLAREADVFALEQPSYDAIYEIIKTRDPKQFLYTIEFYPEEGKYHFDGHRDCNIRFTPEESHKHKNICPKCGRSLTIGVLNRVNALSDQPENSKGRIPFKYVVPLAQIIAESLQKNVHTKAVDQIYEQLTKHTPEFQLLLHMPFAELRTIAEDRIVEGIKRMREGNLIIHPGFDGVYGEVKIFSKEEISREKQGVLF